MKTGFNYKMIKSENLNIEEKILNLTVSYQYNTWSSISKTQTIKETLKEIKSGKYRSDILRLRNLINDGKLNEYTIHKKTLPAVTFCGTFEKERKKSNILNYNSILVLDIDKLETTEIDRISKIFNLEPYIFTYWLSPSGVGLKGLISFKCDYIIDNRNHDIIHKNTFKRISHYFKNKYNINLDISGSDTTRLCFLSFDPNLVIKDKFVQFEISTSDIIQDIEDKKEIKELKTSHVSNKDSLFNPNQRNNSSDRNTMNIIIKFLEKRRQSITYSYQDWYRVAMAIANTFTYDIGLKYFLRLSKMDKEKYNEINCENFLLSCYDSRSGAVKFSSIVFMAGEKGYSIKKQRERGSETVDENLS